jgi:hypothetical protein
MAAIAGLLDIEFLKDGIFWPLEGVKCLYPGGLVLAYK